MRDHDPRSDAELLLATRRDVEAFGVFYRRHIEWVLALAARRLGSPELAADLASDGGHENLPVGGHRKSPLVAIGSPHGWPSDLPTTTVLS
jgi:RNA polymerase sigma-70 factor (ECF subfamily)